MTENNIPALDVDSFPEPLRTMLREAGFDKALDLSNDIDNVKYVIMLVAAENESDLETAAALACQAESLASIIGQAKIVYNEINDLLAAIATSNPDIDPAAYLFGISMHAFIFGSVLRRDGMPVEMMQLISDIAFEFGRSAIKAAEESNNTKH